MEVTYELKKFKHDPEFKACLIDDYVFLQAKQTDFLEVLDFVLRHYYEAEPYSRTLKYTSEEFNRVLTIVVCKALVCPYSLLVKSRRNMQLVGVRLCSTSNRDMEYDSNSYFTVEELRKYSLVQLGRLNQEHRDFWHICVDADITKVLRTEICFSIQDHGKRADLRWAMTVLRMNTKEMVKDGLQGILSETSVLSQTYLENYGYQVAIRAENWDWSVQKTLEVRVMFRDIRPYSVTPLPLFILRNLLPLLHLREPKWLYSDPIYPYGIYFTYVEN